MGQAMMVICNKAKEVCLDWCLHSVAHEPEELETGEFCTSPGECVLPAMDFKDKFKVKCKKVKKGKSN